jgi:2-hydroxy-6-oxo-octa-2,4-dienoate hydrolase
MTGIMTGAERPEIGATISAGGIATNYLEAGSGPPLVFVHGSGPGVTAYANWRLVLPELGKHFHCYAPDMVGFGFTERPEGIRYDVQTWADQVLGFLDALGLERASLVGNSFGGAIALRLAAQHQDRVDRLVLMGSVGVPFGITEGLDAVWGYQPSPANMRAVMDYFAYSRASIQPGFQESFSAMFPAPRQRWVDAMATADAAIAALPHQTLLIHGREDQVIPLATSLRLLELIDRSELHVFGRCGHWTQIERTDEFNRLLVDFLTGNGAR